MDLPEDQASAQAKVSYHRFKVNQSGMDLKNIFIMSELSQSKKEKYHMTTLVRRILKEIIQMILLKK